MNVLKMLFSHLINKISTTSICKIKLHSGIIFLYTYYKGAVTDENKPH